MNSTLITGPDVRHVKEGWYVWKLHDGESFYLRQNGTWWLDDYLPGEPYDTWFASKEAAQAALDAAKEHPNV